MPPRTTRRVTIVVFPGVQTLDAAGPAEVFAVAGRLAGRPLYEVILASVEGGDVRTTSGLTMATRRLRTVHARRTDTALMAGGEDEALERAVADGRIGAWARRAARVVRRIGSVCNGAFLLAGAGLLDGRRAATHWAACERLAATFPRVKVDRDSIFVVDGRLWTSAGVTAGVDMALAMVEEDHGRRLVDAVAAHLVLYVRRPGFQSQWSAALVAQRNASDPLGPILGWARRHLDRPLDVAALAGQAGVSSRTFHRQCVEQLKTTPARLISQLRIERARTLLATSRLGAKEIAAQCGLRDGAELARLCRRGLGLSPREYRTLFGRTTASGRRLRA
jgi:transcriptional regulator GlxA family with amidase domain